MLIAGGRRPTSGSGKGGARPRLLIVHYTGMKSAEDACRWLCDPRSGVSCHYLVDEDGRITQMVDENARAWHAGVASWRGMSDINSWSIGIEVHNPGHDLGYRDFPDRQIDAVTELARDIVDPPVDPGRRRARPFRRGAGAQDRSRREVSRGARSIAPASACGSSLRPFGKEPDCKAATRASEVEALQRRLAQFGYGIAVSGTFDVATAHVVRAFQRHFRPARVDGIADPSTIETLSRLTEIRAAAQVPKRNPASAAEIL